MKKTHLVYLLHGIRTQAEWGQKIAAVLEEDQNIRAIPVRYEYFDLVRFMMPFDFMKRKPVDRVIKMLRDGISERPKHISVIAHSFGTYCITKALEKEHDIILHRLILC